MKLNGLNIWCNNWSHVEIIIQSCAAGSEEDYGVCWAPACVTVCVLALIVCLCLDLCETVTEDIEECWD